MIRRSRIAEAKFNLTQFRALCILGPRQSGKSTLCKSIFKGKQYVNFENLKVQHQVENEQEKFLHQYQHGVIFDALGRQMHTQNGLRV